ncbi:hypothetical protein SO802_019965 [Lithocarpus litseifolius]|uniref:PRA1 family protein n=1 Tax=Lithocarpus litseifolius TaxID=425828 RepID=A0AAW2CDQ7_9ROSI
MFFAVSLLSHPFSLIILLSLLAALLLLYSFRLSDQPLVIMGRTFSDFKTLISLITVTVIVMFLTSVGSLLITAGMVRMGIVCAHDSFRIPKDLFLDEQETSGGPGLFSFIGGAAFSAAAAAATRGPNMMSRTMKKVEAGSNKKAAPVVNAKKLNQAAELAALDRVSMEVKQLIQKARLEKKMSLGFTCLDLDLGFI